MGLCRGRYGLLRAVPCFICIMYCYVKEYNYEEIFQGLGGYEETTSLQV